MSDGGPAFPRPDVVWENQATGWQDGTQGHPGMSLRDWFAGQALAGMHARDIFDEGQATPTQRATLAYIDADAMLAARQPKGETEAE